LAPSFALSLTFFGGRVRWDWGVAGALGEASFVFAFVGVPLTLGVEVA
jgi:hypothetical protein